MTFLEKQDSYKEKDKIMLAELIKLQKEGYIDEDGQPLKCIYCEHPTLEKDKVWYGERGLEEFTVKCERCEKITGHWSYGYWSCA